MAALSTAQIATQQRDCHRERVKLRARVYYYLIAQLHPCGFDLPTITNKKNERNEKKRKQRHHTFYGYSAAFGLGMRRPET